MKNRKRNIREKATSKAQQQAAGIAYAAKKGKIPMSKLKGASKEMIKMKSKDLKDFASTKRSKLPNRVKEAYSSNIKLSSLLEKDEIENAERRDQEQPLKLEDKKRFIEEIKNLEEYGQKLYSPVDLVELAEKLSNFASMAERIALEETDDWFDKVTINRNMKEVRKIGGDITKTATEAKAIQQRMTSLYEDLKHVLGRYFEITDLSTDGKTVVKDEEDIRNSAGENMSLDYLKSNFEDFKDADVVNKKRIARAKRNIS